ncbi:MAG: PAS domain S-box protein [Proteobacteria bacterium]|nr:PAS domain S-box protein [Pseudomonadota bacterium]MBU1582313.1 PAS domain S-box protein [Pseudomonadota bacterium]MBU2451675.1 PAS domain S-box protein [Pseudomonadota bacterium]MBU2630414.1 PAS domain S-box protein [Pseudomonadota bacterium]
MKISIRGVIIVGCIVLVWGTLLISTPFSYFSNKKVMLLHTMDIMENISDLTVKETQNFFSIARGAAHLTKRLISSKVVNTDKDHIERLEKYFFDQLEIYPQFAGIYFANSKGEFYYVSRNTKYTSDGYRTKFIEITPQGRQVKLIWRDKDMNIILKAVDPEDAYDPRKRPWYIKAEKEKQVIWTDPYVFFTSQKPGITTAGPIYDDKGNLLGIVGVDIELDVLSNFIGNLRVGKTGIAFMIDQDSNVIAYPDPEQLKFTDEKENKNIRLPKLWELSSPVCKLAYDAIERAKGLQNPPVINKESIFAAFQSGPEKYYTMFTPVKESKISWMIGVYIPEDDYFGKLIYNQRINLLIVFVLSCIATIIGLYIAQKIIKPISELDREALYITSHNYNPRQKVKTVFIEIQRTADSFHEMKKAVMDYKKELRKEERVHRTITDTANEAILMINERYMVSYWNAAAEKIFGYSYTDAIGKNIFDLASFRENHQEKQLTLNKVFKDASKDPFPKNTALYIQHKNGRRYFVEVSIVHIKIDRKHHTIAVIHDISKRKKLENDKIAALKQLQQAQKMEALGLLAGGVAHDLNNVLSGLVSYPELLLMDLPEESPLRPAIMTIKDSGQKAASIVDDLLTLARRGVTNTEIVNLNEIIVEYLNSPEYKTMIRYHQNVSIKTRLSPDLFNITGTSMHLNKTVMNLMSNAAEAIKIDGKIIISTQNQYMDAPIKGYDKIHEGDYVLLTVKDTGTGINSQELKRIFEPFYTSKIMGRSGTGLGMSVVWGTVQDHNGYIHVDSSPGKGTEFWLYFPATRMDITDRAETIAVKDYMGNGETILVIDDVKEQREIAQNILERLNYRVITVSSGEKAIEFMTNNPADLLLLDMIMDPGIDGLETYIQILNLHPKQKAVIASGFSDDDRVKQAQRLGAGEYVKKPYTFEKIGLAVKKELIRTI